jgi:RimJ/RimL family protein N-acetyltransferase
MILNAIPTTLEHVNNFAHTETSFDVPSVLSFCIDYPNIRPMMSFMDNDRVVFICGLSFISEGVWEAWLIPSKIMHNYAKSAVRSMRDFTTWLLSDFPAHRIQIAVLAEHEKWAKSLGFQFESIVKKYHNQRDHYMYVKVRE